MKQRYLLDTNILSELIKQPASALAEKISNLHYDELCTSVLVACELRYGAQKRGSEKLTDKINALLEQLEILPLDIDVSFHYGNIRAVLEKQGQLIGGNDLLIAAHALSIKAILVTANTREFKRVPGLKIENWIEG